jgi:uncharacterized protein (TIGR02284 family)
MGMGDVQDTLNDLISICRDSEKGFSRAAKGVSSEDLRHRFAGIARQRAVFIDELSAYVKKIGGEPAAAGKPGGVRRKSGREAEEEVRDDASFVAECETVEENTLHHYERALSKDLPVPVRPIVDRHRLAVQETLLDLRGLELVSRAG